MAEVSSLAFTATLGPLAASCGPLGVDPAISPPVRLNGEIKRRSDVVGIFPNEAAVIRLVGALLLEQNDEWATQHRYMTLETLASISDDPAVSLPAVAA